MRWFSSIVLSCAYIVMVAVMWLITISKLEATWATGISAELIGATISSGGYAGEWAAWSIVATLLGGILLSLWFGCLIFD